MRPEESGRASGLVNSPQQIGAGVIVAVAAVVALLGVRAGDSQHAPEAELTAVVDATADAEFAGEAAIPVEP